MFFIGMLIPITIMILVVIYMYKFIGRILSLKIEDSKIKKRVNILVEVVMIIPAFFNFILWTIVILHVFFISLVIDFIYLLIKKVLGKDSNKFEKIYKSGVISLFIAVILLSYGYINMHKVIKTEYSINTEKTIREEGYKVAFISDLHFGTTMDTKDLEKYCQRIQEDEPDIVILGGDIVDERTTLEDMQAAFKVLSQIDSTYGVFYVYGNHDKSNYSSNPNFTEEQLSNTIKNSKIIILEDNTFRINEDITITGRQDRSSAIDGIRKSLDDLVKEGNLNKDNYNILVDHQPNELNEISNSGYDILLSGHTHAGQMWPGGLFIDLFLKDSVSYGHVKNDSMDIIVSSGIAGWGFPLRTEEHCEYVILNIMSK